MPNHTVVAVYETAAQAAAAVRDLQAADILPKCNQPTHQGAHRVWDSPFNAARAGFLGKPFWQ